MGSLNWLFKTVGLSLTPLSQQAYAHTTFVWG